MKNYKFITSWSDFMLTETLISHDINYVIQNTSLNLQNIKHGIKKLNNTIQLTIFDFNNIEVPSKLLFDTLNNLFIDINGWFPSSMIMINNKNMSNSVKYNEDFLIKNQNKIKEITITYEAKYDILQNIPDKLYHLTTKEFKNNIIKNGLCPKRKNKKTIHLDRIYVCVDPKDCYSLINTMKLEYERIKSKNPLNKISIEWLIFEINSAKLDIKMYEDPKYKNKGYYIVENVPPNLIYIYDQE